MFPFIATDCVAHLPNLQNIQPQGFYIKVLEELIAKPDAKQRHLRFLISNMPAGLSRTTSKLKLSNILKKNITDEIILKRLFEIGMFPQNDDIQTAVEQLQDTSASILELILSNSIAVNLTNPCEAALKDGKIKLVTCLIKHGAQPPVEELKCLVGWPRTDLDPILSRYIELRSFDSSGDAEFGTPFEDPLLSGFPDTQQPFVQTTSVQQTVLQSPPYVTEGPLPSPQV